MTVKNAEHFGQQLIAFIWEKGYTKSSFSKMTGIKRNELDLMIQGVLDKDILDNNILKINSCNITILDIERCSYDNYLKYLSDINEQKIKYITEDLSYTEKIELSYLYLKGFRYLVRNQNGTVSAFSKRPLKIILDEHEFWLTDDSNKKEQWALLGTYDEIECREEPHEIYKYLQYFEQPYKKY